MTETAFGVLAAGWAVIMGLSPILQIRRILERRSSKDVSLAYLVVLVMGFVLWVAYGVASENPVLIVPNVIALAVGSATIWVVVRYR